MTHVLRAALLGTTAVAVFATSLWLADEPANAQLGAIPPATGNTARGKVDPTPRLADGTVNLGRVPGEKGTWRVPYIQNMAMRVLGPDGQPVAGASCRARSEGISRNSEPLPGSDGFRIPNVLPGTWDVVGQVEGYGSFDLGRHAVAANAQVDLGTHSLPPRGALLVRLKGRGFEPANMELAVEQVEGGANKTAVFQAEAGALRSPALPPGRYRLLARGANFAPILRDVTIPAGSDVAIDLEAEPAGTVAIEFVPEGLDDGVWQDYLKFELRDAGGKVVATGTPETVATSDESYTGRFLKQALRGRAS